MIGFECLIFHKGITLIHLRANSYFQGHMG